MPNEENLVLIISLSFGVFVVLNIIDFFATRLILSKGGREFNPVVRWTLDNYGWTGFIGLKVLVLGIIGVQLFAGSMSLITIVLLNIIYAIVLAFMIATSVKRGILSSED